MSTQTETRPAVRAYHDAWTTGDPEATRRVLANEIVNPNPLNGYAGTAQPLDEYVRALGRFASLVTGATLISELYGDGEATLLYDAQTTTPVGTVRTAENFKLVDGRIATINLIFDATAWRAMTAQQG